MMIGKRSKASGLGLERLCTDASADWLWSLDAGGGVELLQAWLQRVAYHKHRHDTYAIGLTDTGIQAFDYRGGAHISTPGQVVVLHPDETHDGHAGTAAGFGYRLLYIDPAVIFDAVRVLCGRACTLPFVRDPVVTSPKLAAAIQAAFQDTSEPLALDSLAVRVAEGLIEADPCCPPVARPRHLDVVALERARQFLDAERMRVVHSAELEAVTGLTRYELARQFRMRYGTSPYRYVLMRRLAWTRTQLSQDRPLVDVAFEAGFADQAHFTRMFKATYGITPARYRALTTGRFSPGQQADGRRRRAVRQESLPPARGEHPVYPEH